MPAFQPEQLRTQWRSTTHTRCKWCSGHFLYFIALYERTLHGRHGAPLISLRSALERGSHSQNAALMQDFPCVTGPASWRQGSTPCGSAPCGVRGRTSGRSDLRHPTGSPSRQQSVLPGTSLSPVRMREAAIVDRFIHVWPPGGQEADDSDAVYDFIPNYHTSQASPTSGGRGSGARGSPAASPGMDGGGGADEVGDLTRLPPDI